MNKLLNKILGRELLPEHELFLDIADKISLTLLSAFGDEIVRDIEYNFIQNGLSYFINDRKAFEVKKQFGISFFFNDRFYSPVWDFEYEKLKDSNRPSGESDFRRIKNYTHDIFLLIETDIQNLCEEFLMLGSSLTYDCCELFENCSDEMVCIRQDQQRARLCTYRRKLKKGIVFIGKNRNID